MLRSERERAHKYSKHDNRKVVLVCCTPLSPPPVMFFPGASVRGYRLSAVTYLLTYLPPFGGGGWGCQRYREPVLSRALYMNISVDLTYRYARYWYGRYTSALDVEGGKA